MNKKNFSNLNIQLKKLLFKRDSPNKMKKRKDTNLNIN
jgi:hypothetical protein